MLRTFFYSLIFLLIISCQHIDKNVAPEKKLTEEQMVSALIDVAQLKAIKTNYFKDFERLGINSSEYLCKKHDIDSVTLEENLRYYGYYPSKLKEILQTVYDSLEIQKNELKELIKSRKKKQTSDSIDTEGEEEDDEEDKDFSNISPKVSLKRSAPVDLSKKTRN